VRCGSGQDVYRLAMLAPAEHLDLATLEAGLGRVLDSPRDAGRLDLIVRRPAVGEREVVEEAKLDAVEGLVGDSWRARGSGGTPDGAANPKAQLTLMNVRVAELVAGGRDRVPLAGDQLYVDLDISDDNLPAGTRLAIGRAVVEISDEPHTGCRKFMDRFGKDAHRFVNVKRDRRLNLRGVNAIVVVAGTVRAGDEVRKL
jgi:hypothetical protein